MSAHNILLVVLDSVRARNTSLHGYSRETTPFLESFAQQSTVYEQARAPGVGSPQSHTSMFTGLEVAEHQLTDSSHRLRPGHTVWETLAENGYETGAFSRNTYLTADTIGLSDVFQTAVSVSHQNRFPNALSPHDVDFGGQAQPTQYLKTALSDDTPLKSLYNGIESKLEGSRFEDVLERLIGVPEGRFYTDRFFEWRDSCDGPWAACINYMDAHWPFLPQPEYANWDGVDRDTIREISDPTWEYSVPHKASPVSLT